MIVNVIFDDKLENADVIDIPEHILANIENVQNLFFKWLFDKSNDHNYWVYENGKKKYCSYRSEAFVEWLNDYLLKDSMEKAYLITMYKKHK
jgi:hypothetical protein